MRSWERDYAEPLKRASNGDQAGRSRSGASPASLDSPLGNVMRTRTKTIFGVAALVFIAVFCFGVWVVRQALESPQEAYAVQHTAELLIEYMKRHTNQWPSGWGELRTATIGNQEYFKRCEKKTGGYSAFLDDLERRVAVDFTATPTRLVTATQSTFVPPFRVIWLHSGRNTHWAGLEPNELVADYLKSIK